MKASKPQLDIVNSTQDVNLMLCGQGTGKTHCAGMVSKSFIDHFPHMRGMIAANTYGQLTRSTMFRIREFWKSCGMLEYKDATGQGHYVIGKQPPLGFDTSKHNYDNYSNIISFKNGCVIYIGSLDNYKSLDGMEVGWAILDETKDTKEEAVKEVILGRIRQSGMYISDTGKKTKNRKIAVRAFSPLYVFTSPAKVPWINEWFSLEKFEAEIKASIYTDGEYFKKEFSDKLVTVSSVYMNKDNLPDNYISKQKNNLPSHLHDMLIYGNPFSSAGGEFYKQFNRDKHIHKVDYDSDLPLHITFDFNVNPYMTMVICQIIITEIDKKECKTVHVVDELCLKHPDNSTAATCKKFANKYRDHVTGLFVYGDPSGKAKDTRSEEGYDDFMIIQQHLSHFRPSMRVASSAPSVVMRGNFINSILENQYEGLEIKMSEKCTNTIKDFTFLQEDINGNKSKKKVVDPNTKISYEEYGHTSDALDYFLCQAFDIEYRKYQRGSDTMEHTIKQRPSSRW